MEKNSSRFKRNSAYLELYLNIQNLLPGYPTLTTIVRSNDLNAGSGSGKFYFGFSESITVDGSQILLTVDHAGFLFHKSSGTVTIYATQGDGSSITQTVMDTMVDNDYIELIMKFGVGKIDFYIRKNGGSISAVTTQTTNIPDATVMSRIIWATSNLNTGFNFRMLAGGFSYER